jgi:hypothetical protein
MQANWKRVGQIVVLLGIILIGDSAFAATYYVAGNGSDNNNGTSKTSPWLHAPGMTGCSGSCAAYTPQPGDRFIFRGGDTWHNTGSLVGLPWSITWNGTSGNPIYFGGSDTTWSNGNCSNGGIVDTIGTAVYLPRYGESTVGTPTTPFVWRNGDGSASSWVGGNIAINGSVYVIASVQSPWQLTLTTSAGTQYAVSYSNNLWCRPVVNMDGRLFSTGNGSMVTSDSTSYIDFDMFEVRGMYWNDATQGNSFLQFIAAETNTNEYDVITNLYIHGWSHATFDAASSPENPVMIAQGSNGNVAIGQEDGWNDIDGSDSLDTQYYGSSGPVNCNTNLGQYPEGYCATASGITLEGYYVHDNHLKYLSNGMVLNNPHIFANNVVERNYNSFENGGAQHCNAWEFNGEYAGNTLIYNNLTRNNTTAVTAWINPNGTDYVFNNVSYNNGQQDMDQCSPGVCGSGPDGGQAVYYNNVWVINTLGNGVGVAGYSTFENNFWITSNGASAAHGNETYDVALTASKAKADGYSSSGLYQAPTVTSPGVGAGANLTGACSAISTALCSDSTIGGLRTALLRPNGAWDIGASQFSGASPNTSQAPQPPTGLIATVN